MRVFYLYMYMYACDACSMLRTGTTTGFSHSRALMIVPETSALPAEIHLAGAAAVAGHDMASTRRLPQRTGAHAADAPPADPLL